MRNRLAWLWVLSLSCAVLAPRAQAVAASQDVQSVRAAFLAEHTGAQFFMRGDDITRVYGTAFSFGDSSEASADAFAQTYAGMFGVAPGNLRAGSSIPDDGLAQPVLFDRSTGLYRFTLVYYSQDLGGIPVFRSDLRLLVRNEDGFPLVLAASSLRDLGEFQVPAMAGVLDTDFAMNAIADAYPALTNLVGAPGHVIWAGVDDMQVDPALAIELVVDNGQANTPNYDKRLFLVDALTGQILYEENLVINVDVTGNVSAMATQGVGADICDPEELEAMPYAMVSITGGNSAFADANGDFVIANGGSNDVTVTSDVRGKWFRVFNSSGGGTEVLSQVVTPPGPADFVHNAANSSEQIRAQVNGYIESNVVRDFALAANPNYPVINNQQSFRVNVNINASCNAFYDGSSINFYRSGGGCSNTANTTIVHHEYGHHLVQVGGSGQGEYGEGMGDVMGVLITDTSELAIGFRNDCSQGLRNADNDCQRSSNCSTCGDRIHDCGKVISGCVWSTRNELLITEPDTYREILRDLAVNAILLHSGSGIQPDITVDYLTLDDNDGNIGNGTPHYNEIATGFGAHNMPAPPLDLFQFEYPNGVPTQLEPDVETTFQVVINDQEGQLDESSPALNYSIDGGSFQSVALANQGNRLYEATLPGIACSSGVAFYISAMTTDGSMDRDPFDSEFNAVSGDVAVVFADDFETDKGWTVRDEGGLTTGTWERGRPVGGGDRGDPPFDFDGSGQCYLTDNRDGDSDIDDGTTHLMSPRIDLSAGDAVISYARWYSNNFGADPNNDIFVVAVSNDDGGSWTTAEIVGPAGEGSNGGWFTHSFKVGDFVQPTANVRVRFTASDLRSGSVVEAAVDAFEVKQFLCNFEPPQCSDIKKFVAKCKHNGTIKAKAKLFDTSHNGQTVTISIDGNAQIVTIEGKKAKLSICCYGAGPHTVALDEPAGCDQSPVTVDCP